MMREEVLKLVEECGLVAYGEDTGEYRIPVVAFNDRMDRFYKAAYLAGAKAMQEEAAKLCDFYIEKIEELRNSDESMPEYQPELAGRQAGAGSCSFRIRAINPESL